MLVKRSALKIALPALLASTLMLLLAKNWNALSQYLFVDVPDYSSISIPIVITRTIETGVGEPARWGHLVKLSGKIWVYAPSSPQNKGPLIDEFSAEEPYEFRIGTGHSARGIEQGLEGMKVGERREIIVPAEQSFGYDSKDELFPRGGILLLDVKIISLGNRIPDISNRN